MEDATSTPRHGGRDTRRPALQRRPSIIKGTSLSEFQKHVNLDAINFADYDIDGSSRLDYDEFYAMQPQCIREHYSPSQIQAWAEAADSNGDGHISLNEFFRWSLSRAAQGLGACPIDAIFRR